MDLFNVNKNSYKLLQFVVGLVMLSLVFSSSVSATMKVVKKFGSASFQVESMPSVVELKKEAIYKIKVDGSYISKDLSMFLEATMKENGSEGSMNDMPGHEGMTDAEMGKKTNQAMGHIVSVKATPTNDPSIYEAKLVFPMEGNWQISVVSKSKSAPFNFILDEEVKKIDKKGWIDYANFIAIILVAAFVLFRGKRQLRTTKKTKEMSEAK